MRGHVGADSGTRVRIRCSGAGDVRRRSRIRLALLSQGGASPVGLDVTAALQDTHRNRTAIGTTMSKMTVDLKVGETLCIGAATVRLEQKSGRLARLVIVADEDTPITTPKSRREPASDARMSALHIETGAHHG